MSIAATGEPPHLSPACGWSPPALTEQAIDGLYDDVVAASRTRDRDYSQAALRLVLPREAADPIFGPQATEGRLLPEPGVWVRRIATALLETMTGARSPDQISRWVSPLVHERVAARSLIARRRGGPMHRSLIRRVHVCIPDNGVVEASVVVQHDGRVRAMALRLVGADGRWMVTALELG